MARRRPPDGPRLNPEWNSSRPAQRNLFPDPTPAVRAELRGMLFDLSDALLEEAGTERVQDAVRHALALLPISGVGEGLVALVLRNLRRDLLDGSLDRPYYAQRLQQAASTLSD